MHKRANFHAQLCATLSVFSMVTLSASMPGCNQPRPADCCTNGRGEGEVPKGETEKVLKCLSDAPAEILHKPCPESQVGKLCDKDLVQCKCKSLYVDTVVGWLGYCSCSRFNPPG